MITLIVGAVAAVGFGALWFVLRSKINAVSIFDSNVAWQEGS